MTVNPDGGGGTVQTPTDLPSAVGYVFVDTGTKAFERCVATVIAPAVIATRADCLSTDFAPTTNGGATASGAKVYFVPNGSVGDRSSWTQIMGVQRYQRIARATLASGAKATPIPVSKQLLGAGDVGGSFITAKVTGGPLVPSLSPGSTVVRAVTGQGIKAIYPTLSDWANATEVGSAVNMIIDDGPSGPYALSWQHPLVNGYEAVTRGTIESTMNVASGLDSEGAPLLRVVGTSFEVVAFDYDVLGTLANAGNGKNAVLATYYSTITPDVAAFLGGAKTAENHCLGVAVNNGLCIHGFALNCSEFDGVPTIEDIESTDSTFCGAQTCTLKINQGSVKGTMALCQ